MAVIKKRKKKRVKYVSFGEEMIADILSSLSVKYEREKKFDGLKNKNGAPYRFDFFIEELNCVIEYDGIHHYKKTTYANLKTVKKNDRIKNDWCKKNGIRVLRLRRMQKQEMKNAIIMFFDSL